jgi:hypothetical protein
LGQAQNSTLDLTIVKNLVQANLRLANCEAIMIASQLAG